MVFSQYLYLVLRDLEIQASKVDKYVEFETKDEGDLEILRQ